MSLSVRLDFSILRHDIQYTVGKKLSNMLSETQIHAVS